jgi:hypothetical protein
MRIARLLTATKGVGIIGGHVAALAALVALTAVPATADDVQAPADSSAAQRSVFQAQAEANNLSPEQARSLQAQVDQVVDRTGGTQVAINQVRWDGGDTLIPLPGEARVRFTCDQGMFCTFANPNYTGWVDRMSSCVLHISHYEFRSYINRQTRGTRARFYDIDLNLLSYTKPAPDRGTTSLGGWDETWYIRPC